MVIAGRFEDDATLPAPDGPRDPLEPDVPRALRGQVAHQPIDRTVAFDVAAEPLCSGRVGDPQAVARFVDGGLIARSDLERPCCCRHLAYLRSLVQGPGGEVSDAPSHGPMASQQGPTAAL